MAEAFGARLLAELKSESLDKLLSSLSAALPIELNPGMPSIPFLQDLLRLQATAAAAVVQDHTEIPSAVDPSIPSSPSPPSSPPLRHNESTNDAIRTYVKPPMIEILSATTNTNRTHLINHLITSILPTKPGRPKEIIIYFDCAYKLSISDLHASLLESCNGDEAAVTEALSRLHVIRPESSRQLLTHLRKVEAYIFSLTKKDVVVAAIFLADLSAYYMSERWAEEEAKFQSGSVAEERIYSRESLHTMILAEVGRLQKMFRCVVVVSGLGIASSLDGNASVKSGLAGPWVRAVDVRIVLGKSINNQIETTIDARKWLAACGGREGFGKASCDIHVHRNSVELSELKHET